MTYDARNKRFILLNKVLYKCVSGHYKTLLSLGNCEVEQFNLPQSLFRILSHRQPILGTGSGIFLRDKYEQHSTAVYIFIQKWKNINSAVKNK